MNLHPQDLVLALKIATRPLEANTGSRLASELGLSSGEIHAAISRATAAQLIAIKPNQLARPARGRPSRRLIVNLPALRELVIHGVRYVFVPERGKLTRGVPTAWSAAPLNSLLAARGVPVVWPHAKGEVRGESFAPLFRSAVGAALKDPKLHEVLALVDAIRGGGARERELAIGLFEQFTSDEADHG